MLFATLPIVLSALCLSLASSTVEAAKGPGSARAHARRGVYGQFSVVNPVHLVECEVASLNWTGTKPPYRVGVLVGEDSELYYLGDSNTTEFLWNVDLPANTTVTFYVKGATAKTAYSDPLVIDVGPSENCLAQSNWPAVRTEYGNMTMPSIDSPPVSNMTNATVTAGLGGNAAGAPQATGTNKGDATRATAGLGLLLTAAAALTLVV